MKNLKNFPYTVYYLVLLSSATLFVWSNHLENIGVPIVLGLMFLFFVFSEDTMPTVPLLLNGLFMVSQAPTSFETAPLFLYLTPAVLLGGMIIHIIKYKVNIFRGKMILGIGIMFLAMILSSFNAVNVDIYYFFYASVGLLYAFIYMFYRNTFDRDHTQYLMKMMLILGILISFQVVFYYLSVEDVRYALEHKTINLGWGLSNYVATYLIMFIAITFYFAREKKFGFIWIVVAFTEIALIPFTASRGGMVAFVVLFPFLMALLFIKSKRWLINLVTILLVSTIGLYLIDKNYDFVSSILFRFENILFDDSGRFDIYVDAISKFLTNPLFGGGIFARTGLRDFNMFHNTILHTAATLGSLGLIGLGIQLWQQFRITVKNFKIVNLFLVSALLGAHIHGMVDNVYFMPQFMVLMLIIVSVVESSNTNNAEPVI